LKNKIRVLVVREFTRGKRTKNEQMSDTRKSRNVRRNGLYDFDSHVVGSENLQDAAEKHVWSHGFCKEDSSLIEFKSGVVVHNKQAPGFYIKLFNQWLRNKDKPQELFLFEMTPEAASRRYPSGIS
jgi:hypothetical protein